MRYLRDVHKMNPYRADRLSIRMFQLENRLTDFDEIWYGRYAIGGHPIIVPLNYVQPLITWRARNWAVSGSRAI
jgi:hypothetical protein